MADAGLFDPADEFRPAPGDAAKIPKGIPVARYENGQVVHTRETVGEFTVKLSAVYPDTDEIAWDGAFGNYEHRVARRSAYPSDVRFPPPPTPKS